MRIKRVIAIGLVFLFVLGLATPVLAAEGPGTITGKLIMGTKDGSSIGGLTVTLKTYVNDAESDSTTAQTDAGGNFTFSGLATESKYSYDVNINYQEADYASDRITFAASETSKTVELTIYDATTEDMLTSEMAHTVISPGEGVLRVEGYFVMVNGTDKTYVGTKPTVADPTKKETMRLPVAKGGTGLQYDFGLMECCVFTGGDGFVNTMAVMPGPSELAYSYELKYKGKEYEYTQKFNYPTGAYHFLIQGTGVTATSDRLSNQETLDINGKPYIHLGADDIKAGETITVKLSGLTPAGNQNIVVAAVAVVAVAVVGGGFYTLRRRRQPVRVPESPARMKQRLMTEIARLDDHFESGQIAEEEYRKLRAQKKAQLVVLLRKSRRED
ncbi:MAG: hypothetical protein HY670_06510 [Chloroflexi bacterium]|nr:hypothetical protein [Chloroflexota bacterium]